MNSGDLGNGRNVTGLVLITALPPSPAKIGLENMALGSPPNQTHDRADRCHSELNGYFSSITFLDFSASSRIEIEFWSEARVAELVDALALGASGLWS